MSKTILITGGTGLVGTRLTELLQSKNYTVKYLSRSAGIKNGIESFQWDIDAGTIDEKAFENVHAVIHFAGAGVADKKWTPQRKKEILDSRTKSTQLIKSTLEKIDHKVESVISASAIGYYGWDTGGVWVKEGSRFGDDFLATVTKAWEEKVDEIETLGIRTAKLRIGIVFSEKGGALYELAKPIKYGVGAPLGSGDQYMSWIHIDDLCEMFIYAAEKKEVQGVFNAVGPNPETNKVITKMAAKVLGKPCFLPNVPSFVLKIILGKRAAMVLGGSRVSSEKIQSLGFDFKFPELKKALEDLL
ncbi:TIGR01777 family oxidoreductase [Fulvivirga lutimaris]|uniref:TIGR01777 family oxidoreductase n=1 Tax=Fulvivirga lutimaris TaxID=1819566 RepID=UPI0012BBC1B7|nr:TIGR01777 family oxidoreductase [Fulvivirga lutimaris]MTI38444.1 TIGR01777 family protein [Fulvivirga lutimaris]